MAVQPIHLHDRPSSHDDVAEHHIERIGGELMVKAKAKPKRKAPSMPMKGMPMKKKMPKKMPMKGM